MGIYFSGDHIVRDQRHKKKNVTTCNTRNHNGSTALERSVIDYLEGLGA